MFDDTPFWMRTKHGPLLGIPYALDMNDVMTFALDRNTADEYYARFKEPRPTTSPRSQARRRGS